MGVRGDNDTIIFNRSLPVNEGDVLSFMGPTGSPMVIPENKIVLLLGDSTILSFIGSPMENKGCTVFYNEPLSNTFDEIMILGSVRAMEEILSKRSELKKDVKISGILPSPMQCMMKGICGQCIQRHVNQETGQEHFVFSCQKQIHLLDEVDFEMLGNRIL